MEGTLEAGAEGQRRERHETWVRGWCLADGWGDSCGGGRSEIAYDLRKSGWFRTETARSAPSLSPGEHYQT